MLGNLKKSIVTHTRKVKTVDIDLDNALEQYKQLCATVVKVGTELQSFKTHSLAIFECNAQAWSRVEAVYQGVDNHPSTKRVAAHRTVAEQHKKTVEEVSLPLSSKLTQLSTMFTTFDKQVTERRSALRDLEYYQDKLEKIELDKSSLKTPKDEAHHKQILGQLEQARVKFADVNSKLKAQMITLMSRRGDIMTHLIIDLAAVKKSWLSGLMACLDTPGQLKDFSLPSRNTSSSTTTAASAASSTTAVSATTVNASVSTVNNEEKKTKFKKPAPPLAASSTFPPLTSESVSAPSHSHSLFAPSNTVASTSLSSHTESESFTSVSSTLPPPVIEHEAAPPSFLSKSPGGGPPTKLPPPPVASGPPTKPPPPPVS